MPSQPTHPFVQVGALPPVYFNRAAALKLGAVALLLCMRLYAAR